MSGDDEKDIPEEENGDDEDFDEFDDFEFDITELIDEYIDSTRDNLKGINDGLLKLEKDPTDQESLFEIYRRAHGMKGASATIGFEDIAEVCHKLEDFLREFHEQGKPMVPDAADIALAAMDVVSEMVEGKQKDQEFTLDTAPVIKSMEEFDFENLSGSAVAPSPQRPPSEKKAGDVIDSIRLRIGKVDEMVMLAGNLLAAKSNVKTEVGTLEKLTSSGSISREELMRMYQELSRASDYLGRAVDEMRDAIMEIRLMPLQSIFDNYPRMVRDLARKLDKDVAFELEGGNVLLDRQIIEEINEPLIHMIRNALDHGLETPEVRQKAGKPEKGILTLKAENISGKIIIRLQDDGAGIDAGKVKEKAVSKGIIKQEEADRMNDDEARALIFAPGFSTRDEATDVSGRGVGMDAVNNAVRKLQGDLELRSRTGQGSSMTIILPLTLVSSRLLLVRAGGIKAGIPFQFIESAVRYRTGEGSDGIDLDAALEPDAPPEPKKYLLTVGTGHEKKPLLVSDIYGQGEVLVKSFPDNLANIKFWVGAAQLPSGHLLPVLNLPAVLRG